MSIESPEDLAGMEFAGKVTRAVLEAMKAAVRPGISTRELDEIGAEVMRAFGARSAPNLVYGFPGHNCISVNDEIVHGVPGGRRLVNGDLVKLDVTVEVGGYMGDACETVAVGAVSHESMPADGLHVQSVLGGAVCSASRRSRIRYRTRDLQDCKRGRIFC